MSRLEEYGFDIEREMKRLKNIVEKDDSLTISSRFVKYLIQQAKRLQELEEEIKSHAPEGRNYTNKQYVDLHMENEQLKKREKELEYQVASNKMRANDLENRVEELEVENKRYKQALESASSEMHHALYSHKSDDVKRFYIENAKRIVDEALKGESDD